MSEYTCVSLVVGHGGGGGGERGVTVQIRVKGMTQLMLYCYTDPCSMYSGVPLIWVTVIDTKVHFSMKTEDCMLVELYYDTSIYYICPELC